MRAASAAASPRWIGGMKVAGSCLNFDSDTNLPGGRLIRSGMGERKRQRRTVVDALGDGLEYLDVNGRSRAVVSVILEFLFADYTLGTLEGCKGKTCLRCDARNNRTDIEGEYRCVHVDRVRVEDVWIFGRREDGIWESCREGILIRAILHIRRRKTRQAMALALCISVLSL